MFVMLMDIKGVLGFMVLKISVVLVEEDDVLRVDIGEEQIQFSG